jgi:RHS repeat-associated protein
VWRWDQQEPFGNNPADEDPDGNSVAFDLPLRLPGQRYDAETALHYNYYRDYDPSIGRYGESDPVGLRGGLNTYLYVYANPLHFVDPTGLAIAEELLNEIKQYLSGSILAAECIATHCAGALKGPRSWALAYADCLSIWNKAVASRPRLAAAAAQLSGMAVEGMIASCADQCSKKTQQCNSLSCLY